MKLSSQTRSRRRETGYVLLLVLFMVALVSLVIITAAPSMVMQIRRDREEELIHRGNQYAKAIRRFYKKFGRYPNSVKDLLDTNHLRFLRREYKDPMTDDGKWDLIHFGQAHFTPTGLFGKSLGPENGPLSNVSGLGGAATPGNSNANNSTAGGSSSNPNPPDSNSAGSAAASSSPNGTANPNSIFSSNGPTLGGGPIVGVASTSKQKSIKEINKKDHYNEWEFVYDPRMELPLAAPAVPANGLPGNTNQNAPNASTAPMPK